MKVFPFIYLAQGLRDKLEPDVMEEKRPLDKLSVEACCVDAFLQIYPIVQSE